MTIINKYSWLKGAAVGIGVLLVLTLICMVISLIGSVAAIRQTEPYQHSVDLAINSPKVHQALGEPVTARRFPQGAVNSANGGDAELYIPIHGPDGNATIRVNGTNINGSWKYYAIRVDTDRGEHINLLEP